ncbi:MAG: hypothetical protein ABJP48_02540 [Erythrobacter sp.]
MTEVQVTLDFSAGYACSSKLVEIAPQKHTSMICLEPGEHEVKTDPFAIGKLGKFENRTLLAQLVFSYIYDADAKNITVFGPDFASASTMHLITYPERSEERCIQRSTTSALIHDDLVGNPHWNYLGALTPGLEPFLRAAVRNAIKDLIANLIDLGSFGITVREPPPTLSTEDHLGTLMVYRNGEFVEYFDPEKEYSSDFSYIGVESTFEGIYTFSKNADFANVIGSTDDPYPKGYKSWISLWRDKCNGGTSPTDCASDGYPKDFTCNTPIIGGHIVTGTKAYDPAKDSTVYIIPICNAHNGDDKIHMEAINWQKAAQLKYWAKDTA